MLLYYLCLAGSGLCALASLWYSLLQDAYRFFLSLAFALALAMLSEMQHRFCEGR
jgi:hypothetical protein